MQKIPKPPFSVFLTTSTNITKYKDINRNFLLFRGLLREVKLRNESHFKRKSGKKKKH